MLLAVRVPPDNSRGPLFVEQALAGIHQGNPKRLPVGCGFLSLDGDVTLFCRFPKSLKELVERQLYAQFPDASLVVLPEPPPRPDDCTWIRTLEIRPDLFPIRRYPQFEDALGRQLADPVSAILAALHRDSALGMSAQVEFAVRPASRKLRHRAQHCLHKLASPFFRTHPNLAAFYVDFALSPWLSLRVFAWLFGMMLPHAPPATSLSVTGSRQHDREDDIQAAGNKLGKLLFECQARISISGPAACADQAADALNELAAAFGPFSLPRLASFQAGPIRILRPGARPPDTTPFLLSTEELATLFHPPTATVRSPELTQVESRELPAPTRLPEPSHPDLALLGEATFRGTSRPCGILPDDRRRHLAILGKTGMGKSTLLHQILASDIRAGRGVGLIDPHGDLAEAVLANVPRGRTNDVIVFDAGDTAFPLSFNILDCPNPADRPLVASGIVSAFKKLHREFWGPRLEHILRNAVLALLEVPGSTLVSLLRILSEPGFRRDIAGQIADPIVRQFWLKEFAGLPPKLQAEAVAPIQNKVGHFVSSPILRNMLGQPRNALALRDVLDQGRVLLVNLSKGRIGDDASALLGSFLVTGLQLAAMSRADVPEAKRRDFYLYVDEFQNFATESFASILSEARKYRLNLTLANQYLAQIDEATLHALFGNVGTLVSFQVGAKDAELLAEQFGGDLTEPDLLRLPRYQAYVRLLVDGMPSRPFSLRTLPPPEPLPEAARPAVVRRASRHRYARPVAEVERAIAESLSR